MTRAYHLPSEAQCMAQDMAQAMEGAPEMVWSVIACLKGPPELRGAKTLANMVETLVEHRRWLRAREFQAERLRDMVDGNALLLRTLYEHTMAMVDVCRMALGQQPAAEPLAQDLLARVAAMQHLIEGEFPGERIPGTGD